MKSRDLIFLAIVVLVVGGLYFLSTRNKAKAMPSTVPEHFTVTGRDDCFKCHTREKFAELERLHKHPGKWRDERVSCLLCHKIPDASKALNFRQQDLIQITDLLSASRRKSSEDFLPGVLKSFFNSPFGKNHSGHRIFEIKYGNAQNQTKKRQNSNQTRKL